MQRLLVYSLLIGTLPLIALGVFSYLKSSSAIQTKVSQGNMQNLKQTQSALEQVLISTDYLIMQFANSPLVNSVADQPLTKYEFEQVNDLNKGIVALQFTDALSNAYIVNRRHNWVISLRGLEKLNEHAEAEKFERYAQSGRSSVWLRDRLAGQDRLLLVKKLPLMYNHPEPGALLIAELSAEQLVKTLTQSQELGEIIVLNEAYDIMFNGNKLALGHDDETDSLLKALSSRQGKEGSFDANFRGQDVAVTYRKSAYSGWHYLNIVDSQDMIRESKEIGWATLLVTSVLFLFTLFVAMQGSRKMYSPVRKLQSYARKVGSIGDDAHLRDEFGAIEAGLQSLVTRENKLLHQVQIQFPYLKELFVIKLVLGQVKSSELDYNLRTFQLPTAWEWLVAMTIRIDSLDNTRFNENDSDLLLFAIHNMAGEIVPAAERISPVVMERTIAIIITSPLPSSSPLRHRIDDLAAAIQHKVKQYLEISISIGVSRPYKALEHTGAAYEEALEALSYGRLFGPDLILHANDVDRNKRLEPIYSKQRVKDLHEAIHMFDEVSASLQLMQIINELRSKNLSSVEIHAVLLQLFSGLLSLLQEDEALLKKMIPNSTEFQTLFQARSLEEWETWFQNKVIVPIIELLRERQQVHYSGITEQIIKIVSEEYENITLESCAARINFHPNYASRVFKKETGITFTDYVSQYRLEVAKKWLNETDMKVSEIAERLNYTSPASFIRYFRKTTGLTPGQFREKQPSS
jgi:AraC-like DNA-binding protein